MADREDAVVETIRFPDDPELVRVDRAVLDPALPVQVEHRARRGVALREAGQRVALAADVIAVLADQDVEPPDRDVHSGAEPLAAQAAERDERGLRRVPGDVDRAGQQSVVLILVGRVERDVDRRPLRVEEVADDFPDHRDLGVVHHCPDLQRARHQNTSRPHRARPMNS